MLTNDNQPEDLQGGNSGKGFDSAQPDSKETQVDKGKMSSPFPILKGDKKRRRIRLPRHSRINTSIIKELDALLEYVPPERLSRNLRNLLLSHLDYEKDAPQYLEELIADLYFVFQFLDAVGDELDEI